MLGFSSNMGKSDEVGLHTAPPPYLQLVRRQKRKGVRLRSSNRAETGFMQIPLPAIRQLLAVYATHHETHQEESAMSMV